MNLPILFKWSEAIKSSTPPFSQKGRGDIETVVCPPFTHLEEVKKMLPSKVKLGAQNCFWQNSGAYTGEISPKMLKDLGVDYVIIGHSERRKYLGETDEMINKKVLASLRAGLKVVLCVGEDLLIRKRGLKALKNYVKKQLEKDLKRIQNSKFKIQNSLIVAYEPIWAISTSKSGHSDTPENALEMIKFIKKLLITYYSVLNTKVLYGGSVDSKNIKNFLKYPEIDGALVGGASLKAEEVKKIIKIVAKLK